MKKLDESSLLWLKKWSGTLTEEEAIKENFATSFTTGEKEFRYNQELSSVRSALRNAVNEAYHGMDVIKSSGDGDEGDQDSLMLFKKLYDELSSILEEVELIYGDTNDRIHRRRM